jgi:hypothetical protein
MRRAISLFSVSLVLCLIAGCASVNFYTSPNLTGKTGLKYYNVKPYLLVELNATKDNSVKTSVIYLPDMANPGYIAVKPGFGSSELKVALTNGYISSVGLLNESKIPESMDAIAALLSKSGYAVNQFTQAGPPSQSIDQPDFRLFEIVVGKEETTLKEVKTSPPTP